jgi:uracil-DNA glycosylase
VGAPADFTEVSNQHYRATKHILGALLGCCDVSDVTNKAHTVRSEDTLSKRFAMTNHYHCAFRQSDKKHGVRTTDFMWENCAEIVRLELEILKPHVVVIQSGWSARESSLQKSRIDGVACYFDNDWTITESREVSCLYEARHISGRLCYVIGSYHPSFHLWNDEEYLVPLKKRISMVRLLVSVQNDVLIDKLIQNTLYHQSNLTIYV